MVAQTIEELRGLDSFIYIYNIFNFIYIVKKRRSLDRTRRRKKILKKKKYKEQNEITVFTSCRRRNGGKPGFLGV